MSNYYITPVCKVLSAENYRDAKAYANKRYPGNKVRPVACTGVVTSEHKGSLDIYA